MSGWTFLTNHARVLLCLSREPNFRLRDIAGCAGITERAAHRIVSELCEAGYITRHRMGARNYYELHLDQPLRHPYEKGANVGDLLRPLLKRPDPPE
ncbi:MAG: MarR family winged helix-turn-helix transcriptional regulator [Actinobacteria bacterium]|nr:MarR family winged helix-turn-helix transcriptional regulator [Actinomycetota bacterium]MBW3651248.1 MarR family winged helix-turn-helix transcriptional regulator [Actinomycetota bacterium]